jgi:hypothetical protein
MTEFPRVTRIPKKERWLEILDLVKPVFNGSVNITESKNILATMNILEMKRFRICNEYLLLLKAFALHPFVSPSDSELLSHLDFDLPKIPEV